MKRPCGVGAAVLGLLVLAPVLSGQERISLGDPEWTVPGAYSDLRGVRELSDGRLLFTDWIEERVAVYDPVARSVRDLFRVGPGPGEFRLPTRLLPLPEDTTLLIDQGNQRLLLIGPDLQIQGTHPGPRSMRYRPTPRATDAAGDLYFTLPGYVTGRAPGSTDSIRVWRWDRESAEPEALARIRGSTPRSDAGGPRMTPGIPFVMFAPEDGWAVGPDGQVALVRSEGYRVDTVREGGAPTTGPEAPATSRPVTEADRRGMVRDFLEGSPLGGRGEGMQAPPVPSEREVAEMVRTNEFAETVPHFDASRVHVDPSGRTWVGLWATGDEAPAYDLFAANGRLVGHVELSGGRRILGFGNERVLVVATDEFGLQRLEAYRLPAG